MHGLIGRLFINDKHHDCIIDINFSHDGRTMAAISKNGIVSVVNLSTQSQMIVENWDALNQRLLAIIQMIFNCKI